MTLVPAYGRDYKSKKEVLVDWNEGKDFIIQDMSAGKDDGRYINRHDSPKISHNIRFKRNMSVCVIAWNEKKQAWV